MHCHFVHVHCCLALVHGFSLLFHSVTFHNHYWDLPLRCSLRMLPFRLSEIRKISPLWEGFHHFCLWYNLVPRVSHGAVRWETLGTRLPLIMRISSQRSFFLVHQRWPSFWHVLHRRVTTLFLQRFVVIIIYFLLIKLRCFQIVDWWEFRKLELLHVLFDRLAFILNKQIPQ